MLPLVTLQGQHTLIGGGSVYFKFSFGTIPPTYFYGVLLKGP